MRLRYFFYVVGLFLTLPGWSQNSQQFHYQVEADASFSGDNTQPFYFSSNKFGAISPLSNAGYLRGEIDYSYQAKDWKLKAGLDVIGTTDPKKYYANHSHVQQLFGEVSYKKFKISLGQKEENQMMLNPELSSGNMVWSNNMRPIPQVKLGTSDFVAIPGTNGWVNFFAEMAYGQQTDGGYNQEVCEMVTGEKRPFSFIDNPKFHRKNIFLRSKEGKLLVLTLGVEHVAQFGGKIDGKKQPSGFKDAARVFFVKSGNEEFRYTHLGALDIKVDANFDFGSISGYTQLFFDDKPMDGSLRQTGADGLWGLEWKTSKISWLNNIVAEYLTTMNQGGRVYTNEVYVGNNKQYHYDCITYYDDQAYGAYTNYGMNMGSPMLTSPIYNKSHWPRPANTLVRAFHLGLKGDVASSVSYKALLSYRKTWGTTVYFLPQAISNTSALLEVSYHKNGWSVVPSFGFDSGKIYGNHAGFMLCLKKSGIF